MSLRSLAIKIFNTALRGKLKLVDDSSGLQTLQVEVLKGDVRNDVERYQDYGFTSHPGDDSEMIIISPNGNRDQAIAINVTNRKDRLKGIEKHEVAVFHKNGDVIHFKNGNIIELKTKTLNIISENEVNITTKKATVECEEAKVSATTKAEIITPEVLVTAVTKATFTTPLLEVSGLLTCAGLAAGAGAVAAAGKAVIEGEVEVNGSVKSTGDVEDSLGKMSLMRTQYNSHYHDGAGTPSTPMS